MLKTCSKCGDESSEFGRSSRSKDGYRSQCKPCEKTYNATRNPRDWKVIRADMTQEERRDRHYRHRYGISLQEYDWMLESQGGVCAICSTEDPGAKGRFHVDHDHETQEIRGLLCHACNVTLGQMKDSPDLLMKAIIYLKEYGL